MTSPALPLDGFGPSPRADRRVGSGVGLGTMASCLLHAALLAPWLLIPKAEPRPEARPMLVEMLALPLPPAPPPPSAAAAEPVALPPPVPTLAPAPVASAPADPAPTLPPKALAQTAAAVPTPNPIAVPSRPSSRPLPPTVPASADRARRPVRSAAPLSSPPASPESVAANPEPAPMPAPTPSPPAELPILHQPSYREPPASPIYPPQAKRLEQEGTVLLRIRIDTAGDPQDVRVFDGSGFDLLDQAALRAARQWRFQPARRDGHPIPAWVEIPVRFRLS